MKTAITIIALCALSTVANAQSNPPNWGLVVHGLSYHTDRMTNGQRYNEVNVGVGLRYRITHDLAIQGGHFKNSINRQANYLIVDYTPLHFGDSSAGLFAGRVTGYPLTKYAAGVVLRADAVAHPRLGVALRITPKWGTSPSATAAEIIRSF